jgi:hypothetical protein
MAYKSEPTEYEYALDGPTVVFVRRQKDRLWYYTIRICDVEFTEFKRGYNYPAESFEVALQKLRSMRTWLNEALDGALR